MLLLSSFFLEGTERKFSFLLTCANVLVPIVRSKLPVTAIFRPPDSHEAIEEMRKYLVPGAQKTKGCRWWTSPSSWYYY